MSGDPVVGSLCQGLPPYVYDPPVEAVVFGWGVSEDGQLALDTSSNVLSPKVVEALLGTRLRGREFGRAPLVAGSRNTLAISAEGEVYSWGWNARGTLGHGHREPERKPRRIAGLRGVDVEQVALGGWHALAVDFQGRVWAWGGNEYEQCGHASAARDVLAPTRCLEEAAPVAAVAAGGMHSLALTTAGHLWMWGEPWGDFSMTIDRSPRRIGAPAARFVRVACGAFHNLALSQEGHLYTWGINDFGQLGNGTTSYATQPQRIEEGLEGVAVADVAAGGWHSVALGAGGEVFVFGRGEYGRLGLGDKSGSSRLRPTRVRSLEGVRIVEATCGGTHTIVVSDDGRAWIWGRGALGRLGTGTEADCISPVELKLPGGPDRWRVISAAAGGRHSFVLGQPDNGNLAERQAAWLARRSPTAGSPAASLARMQQAAEDGGGAAVAAAAPAADGAWQPAHDAGGWAGPEARDEDGALGGDEEDEDDEEGEEEGEESPSPQGTSLDGGSVVGEEGGGGGGAVEGSLARMRLSAGSRAGSSAASVRSSHERPTAGMREGAAEEEGEEGGRGVRRAQSLAAVTAHGLRDDLPRDRA